MKKSSNLQLSFDVESFQRTTSTSTAQTPRGEESPWLNAPHTEWPALEFKGIGVEHAARAASAKTAGRINASKISEAEHRSLLEERHRLVAAKFENGLSRRQQNRLKYIDWSLDRIEDAKHGLHLDMLEAKLELYERLANDIASLRSDLARFAPKKRR